MNLLLSYVLLIQSYSLVIIFVRFEAVGFEVFFPPFQYFVATESPYLFHTFVIQHRHFQAVYIPFFKLLYDLDLILIKITYQINFVKHHANWLVLEEN